MTFRVFPRDSVAFDSRPIRPHCILSVCLLALFSACVPPAQAGVNPRTGAFTYTEEGDVDNTLGQIGLYLINRKQMEGSTFISEEVNAGIVGYQLRFFDNGNRVADDGDWLSVRRYHVPSQPDTTQPEGYFKNTYIEYVDHGLDGFNRRDNYFINGRQFDLGDQPPDVLRQYQVQIESGISAFIRQIGYQTILEDLGAGTQTRVKKTQAFEDGSLPSSIALGNDLPYVFRPIRQRDVQLNQKQMVEEIREHIGFVYNAIVDYTDIQGYRFREIADQFALLQRVYDPMEVRTLTLIMDALFDTNGDGIITPENIKNGYQRFIVIHRQLADNARGLKRRIILPNEKLARLRKEYETVHKKTFKY